MQSLIELAEHKLGGESAGDAKAVAPGKGDIQNGHLGRVSGVFLENILEGGPADVTHPRLIERYLKSTMKRGDDYVDYRAAMIKLMSE